MRALTREALILQSINHIAVSVNLQAMSRGEHTPNQALLIFLHNIGAVTGKPGKTVEELVKTTDIKREELEEIISSQLNSGYLEYSTDEKGTRYYKLTGRGIIRVSSYYT